MIALHVETVLLQCAAGMLTMLWVTHRRDELSAGYAWIVRAAAGSMSVAAAFLGLRYERNGVVVGAAVAVALMTAGSNVLSWWRSRIGPPERLGSAATPVTTSTAADTSGTPRPSPQPPTLEEPEPSSAKLWRLVQVREYVGWIQRSTERIPIRVDIVTACVGTVGVVAGGITAVVDPGASTWVSVVRMVAGALFLGSIIDLILLAHWYLAQTGLPRELLVGMVDVVGWTSVPLVPTLLWSPGMISVFTGAIDDGYNGMLGWFWAACAVTTIALVFVIRAVLREGDEAAIMAGVGLTHIILLTAFGTDLVARAILSMG